MTNPFLNPTSPPDWVEMTPEHLEPAITTAIQEAKAAIEAIIKQDPASLTYDSTFQALEDATESLYRAWGRVNHLDSVANNDAQREALNQMLPVVTEFSSSIPLNGELWAVLKVMQTKASTAELSPTKLRHVEETCASFINAGADLPPAEKERFASIQSELSQKTQKYSENVLDSTNDWELIEPDDSRLAGLPSSAVKAAAADALAKGHGTEEAPQYRFSLQFPSMFPVMQFADNDSIRKEIWAANQEVGKKDGFDNSELIREIIKLRQEKAQLLGFDCFADWATSRRMAKSGAKALSFTTDLHVKVNDAFEAETAELQNYKAEKTGTTSAPMEPWETSYWAEERRKELYDFDEEEVRPYFPLDRVMQGLFDLSTRILGIEIKEASAPSHWHEEVKYYDLKDSKSGDLLGSFYADWHPRESKRGGAWMNSFETGVPAQGDSPREPHLGLICGNMTKPVGDQPALMTHREVETIFHEFGHLIHQLLSEVEVKALSGTNVAWDFVELPSQLMENFCWARESLDFFALHHETGEPIPEELYQKMLAARNYMSASGFMRQLGLGKLDLELHHNLTLDFTKSWEEIDKQVTAGYRATLATESASMVYRFSHLFSSPTGYAAGYYSYKWAEVLDADAFTKFEEEGLLNPEVGMQYREAILSKGNSAEPDQLFRDFMGRDPELEPLLKRSGISQ